MNKSHQQQLLQQQQNQQQQLKQAQQEQKQQQQQQNRNQQRWTLLRAFIKNYESPICLSPNTRGWFQKLRAYKVQTPPFIVSLKSNTEHRKNSFACP